MLGARVDRGATCGPVADLFATEAGLDVTAGFCGGAGFEATGTGNVAATLFAVPVDVGYCCVGNIGLECRPRGRWHVASQLPLSL